MELPSQEKLNNFEIVIPLRKPESILSQSTNPTKGKDKTPAQDPAQDPDQESAQDPAQEQPAPLQQMPVTGLYNLQKYNWDQNQETETDNKIAKQIRAILALIKQEGFDLDSQETVFAISEKTEEIVQILISKLYSTAVANLIYKLE